MSNKFILIFAIIVVECDHQIYGIFKITIYQPFTENYGKPPWNFITIKRMYSFRCKTLNPKGM